MKNLKVCEDEAAKNQELKERKYILSHDDESGEICVNIVKSFDNYKMCEQRDEVFGSWEDKYFVFECFLDNESSKFSTKARFLIFKGHLQNSLLCMVKADKKIKISDTYVPVKEIYHSSDKNYNKDIIEKSLYDYVYTKGEFVEYKNNFDYKSLRDI